VAVFDFSADKSASEPMSCSIYGPCDAAGDITGIAGGLITHPADIWRFAMETYSDIGRSNLDYGSLGDMKAALPGLRFGSIIKTATSCDAYCNRLLYQCLAAQTERPGRLIGVMTLDPNRAAQGKISDKKRVSKRSIKVSATPASEIANNILVNYALNVSTGQYEGQLKLNCHNHTLCRHSYN
jgi:hypothetical protein